MGAFIFQYGHRFARNYSCLFWRREAKIDFEWIGRKMAFIPRLLKHPKALNIYILSVVIENDRIRLHDLSLWEYKGHQR